MPAHKTRSARPTIDPLEDRCLLSGACTLSFYSPTNEVWENGRKFNYVYVRRVGGDKTDAVSVRLSSQDVTTAVNRDYHAAPLNTTLTFRPGECGKVVRFPVINDGLIEKDERLRLVLSHPGGNARLGPITRQEVTIIDNDSPLRLWNLTFSGPKFHAVSSDNGQDTYSLNQWLDINTDGAASGLNERSHPVCYTAGSTMEVNARFKMLRSAVYRASRLPDPCLVRAAGTNGINVRAARATLTENGGSMTLEHGAASQPFANHVDAVDQFRLDWSYTYDRGKTWYKGGASYNPLYLTLNDPDPGVTLRHSLLGIGCEAAKGTPAGQDAQALQAIWNKFSSRNVSRVNSSTPMTYYGDPNTKNLTTERLLTTGDGQCGAWANLFGATLRAQGIGGAKVIEVTGWDAARGQAAGLLVNNWAFHGEGSLDAFGEYRYKIDLSARTDPSKSDAIPLPGLAGQGGTNPPHDFVRHYLVEVGGRYYDPSYGGASYASQPEWENAALAGFYHRTTVDGHAILAVKQNDPKAVETRFKFSGLPV
jgi:hypothetical protein